MGNSKRGFLDIVGQILECLISDQMKKTHVTYRCKLDTRSTERYLKIMKSLELIENNENETIYRISGKGIKFLNHYKKLQSILDYEDLNYAVNYGVRKDTK